MNMKPRQRYTVEFKSQAVDLISTGKPVSKIAKELCIGSNLLKLENAILKKAAIILGSRPQPTPTQSSDQDIGVEIETIFKHHRCLYGYRRIKDQLANHMRTEIMNTSIPIIITTGNIPHSANARQPNSRPKSTLLIKQQMVQKSIVSHSFSGDTDRRGRNFIVQRPPFAQ
jgi:hypothetical protein